jgi:hypothetical protein
LYGKNEKREFYCLCSALIEKHDFYCSVIPWNSTILYSTGTVFIHCCIVSWGLG